MNKCKECQFEEKHSLDCSKYEEPVNPMEKQTTREIISGLNNQSSDYIGGSNTTPNYDGMNTTPKEKQTTKEVLESFDEKFNTKCEIELQEYLPYEYIDRLKSFLTKTLQQKDKEIEEAKEEERERIYAELQKIADYNDCKIKEGFIESSVIYRFINLIKTKK